MDGREVALATLHREDVPLPCLTNCWITHSAYISRVVGRDYWSDTVGVFCEFVRRIGANLVPQWYIPGEAQRMLEIGQIMHATRQHEDAGFRSPEDVRDWIEQLPDDEVVEREFDLDAAAEAYAQTIIEHSNLLGSEVLVIDSFGQADFMGGYTRWGYENYLAAAGLYPAIMRRYYHWSALNARLRNMAIAQAIERHGLAPFCYGGQDICGSGGPLMSPAMLREIYFPELKWAMAPLVEAGIGVIWHCDGNILPILPDLLDLGVVGLQGFEEEHGPRWEDMCALTAPDGGPMIVWGCVSVTTTLPHGTPDDVRRAVERSFTVAGRGRGHVLSSTSSVLPETPMANIDALFEHTHRFGREFLGG
ncbi:MAG: uroporphyrinogen decarboxylase family protein [Armatimonadota bacterium]